MGTPPKKESKIIAPLYNRHADKNPYLQFSDKILLVTGRIDILSNCFGIAIMQTLENITEDSWDYTIDVNVKGTFLLL